MLPAHPLLALSSCCSSGASRARTGSTGPITGRARLRCGPSAPRACSAAHEVQVEHRVLAVLALGPLLGEMVVVRALHPAAQARAANNSVQARTPHTNSYAATRSSTERRSGPSTVTMMSAAATTASVHARM